jgi:hypothetical protein|tara:strand:- start:7129 stop:7560 length:432 start_codon:yes stop_codon:yes gene_type:complete
MEEESAYLRISNVDKLINFSRRLIYHNFGDSTKEMDDDEFIEAVKKLPTEELDEMDELLPFQECKTIAKTYIKKKRHKKTKQVMYFLKESDYNIILLEYNQRMVSNIVASLVSKGHLDMAFDNDKNDFVFWVKKEDEEEDIEE